MFSLRHLLSALLCTSCFSQENRPLRGLQRPLSQKVVSTACQKIRSKPYSGRLDLFFIYVVKYKTESKFNLLALNTAVSNHLVSVLNDCDVNGEAQFAVEMDPESHTFLAKQDGMGKSSGSIEVQIRGKETIYLDGDAAAAKARSYSTIQSLLDDTNLLEQLSGLSIVDSFFVRSLGDNLVVFVDEASEKGKSTKSNSTGIVIAATVVSLVLISVFLYGMYRREKLVGQSNLSSMKQALAHLYNKRRRFFENLPDDEEFEPSWMATSESAIYERCPPPSITWSVSDLTSDSHSIRTPMQLDRIVEEHNSEESAGSGEHCEPPSHIYRHFDPAELNFVAQWKDASSSVCSSRASSIANDATDSFDDIVLNRFGSDHSEEYGIFALRGCQFLPDASFDEISTHVSLPLQGRSDVPLDCSLSPDSTSTKDRKGPDTSSDQVVRGQGPESAGGDEIRTTTASSATLVLDLNVLLWWFKLWIDFQRGRSEPRLKSGY